MPAIGAVVAIAGTIGSAAAGVVGVSVAATSVTAAVIGGALVGAVVGGVNAAINGGDVLQGALTGGLIGGALMGTAAWLTAPVVAGETTAGTGVVAGSEGAAGGTAGSSLGAANQIEAAALMEAGGGSVAPTVTSTVTPTVTKAALSTGEKMLLVGSIATGLGEAVGQPDQDTGQGMQRQPGVVVPNKGLVINSTPASRKEVVPAPSLQTESAPSLQTESAPTTGKINAPQTIKPDGLLTPTVNMSKSPSSVTAPVAKKAGLL